MRFAFTEEQTQIRDAVRELFAGECPPGRVREAWARRDDALHAAVAGLGILGLNVPEHAGGLGLGACAWVRVCEEAGRAAAPLTLPETFAANPVIAALEPELAARVVAGEARVGAGLAGGTVPDADAADVILLVQGSRVSRVHHAALTGERSVDGARRLFRVEGSLEPLDADGHDVLDRAALATAAELLGLARHMLDVTVDYARQRTQFGKPIGAFQAVQHHLVDALLRLRFAAPAVYRAAWSLDQGLPDRSIHVSMAKVYAAEAAELTARKALQVHGAVGYTFEHDLHLWMKRAWSLSRAWGDTGWHLERVSAHVLGDP